jgi:hypothetical protein
VNKNAGNNTATAALLAAFSRTAILGTWKTPGKRYVSIPENKNEAIQTGQPHIKTSF